MIIGRSFLGRSLPKDCLALRAGGRVGVEGRQARPLDAGVHVGLVVPADVEDVVAALEGAREALQADVGRAAVAAGGHHVDAFLQQALVLHGVPDARGDGRRVLKQAVNPRGVPRTGGVARREDLGAPGGVREDALGAAGLDDQAHGQGLAATHARRVAGLQDAIAVIEFHAQSPFISTVRAEHAIFHRSGKPTVNCYKVQYHGTRSGNRACLMRKYS